jgi:hypothetical protein
VAAALKRVVLSGEQPIASASDKPTGGWRLGFGLFGRQLSVGGVDSAGSSGKAGPDASGGEAAPPAPRGDSWRLVPCGMQSASPATRLAMSHIYSILSRDFGYTLGDYRCVMDERRLSSVGSLCTP